MTTSRSLAIRNSKARGKTGMDQTPLSRRTMTRTENTDSEVEACFCLLFLKNGMKIKIKIDINRATTPPSLLGIDRKIARSSPTSPPHSHPRDDDDGDVREHGRGAGARAARSPYSSSSS